jgi:hypothetical protein
MSLGELGAAHSSAKRLATQLQRAASSLTDQERAVLELRRKSALELRHALARDLRAIRERMKKEAEVGT